MKAHGFRNRASVTGAGVKVATETSPRAKLSASLAVTTTCAHMRYIYNVSAFHFRSTGMGGEGLRCNMQWPALG